MILPLRTLDLGNDFDAVAGRLVLMYMADPAEAVKGFAQRLRPGGIVAFQEADFTQYRTFVDAGLPAPMMHYEALVGGADTWAGYPYAVQGFTSFLPLFEQLGIATAEEVGLDTLEERLKQEVKAAKRPLLLPPHVTAYARVG